MTEVGGPRHAERAETLAEACLAWSREALPALPRSFSYWEPEASGPDEWQGAAFLEALRGLGHEIAPWKEGEKAGTLVVGAFLNPRAYTGRIEYDEDEKTRVRAALKAADRGVVASFGSPWVFAAAGGAGLCSFSKNDPAQRALARALAGKLPVKGRMPVPLG
jgi:hypothetical protein